MGHKLKYYQMAPVPHYSIELSLVQYLTGYVRWAILTDGGSLYWSWYGKVLPLLLFVHRLTCRTFFLFWRLNPSRSPTCSSYSHKCRVVQESCSPSMVRIHVNLGLDAGQKLTPCMGQRSPYCLQVCSPTKFPVLSIDHLV